MHLEFCRADFRRIELGVACRRPAGGAGAEAFGGAALPSSARRASSHEERTARRRLAGPQHRRRFLVHRRLQIAQGARQREVPVSSSPCRQAGYRLAATAHAEATLPLSSPAHLLLAAGSPVRGREQWLLLRPLDISPASEVWLAQHPKTHELRVFKFVSHLARLRTLKREVTVFRFLRESLQDRRYLVQILEWNFKAEPYFLESEYGGPNLAEWAECQGGLAAIPVELRLRVLAEISRAVSGVHAVGVLHKDLKPSNVLVTRLADGADQIKIADFGSALLLEPSRLEELGITRLGLTQTAALESSSFSGTLLYLAPEVFSGKAATAQSDVYALGVMLYQMVVGDFRKPLSPGWEEEEVTQIPYCARTLPQLCAATPRVGFAARRSWPNAWKIWRHAARNEIAGKASCSSRRLPNASARRPASAGHGSRLRVS